MTVTNLNPRVRSALAVLFATTAMATLLASCGGGSSAPAPAPAPTGPSAVGLGSVLPADGTTGVDVQDAIVLSFTGSLSGASVTREHVRLVSGGVPVATRLTYDAVAHTITVDPMGLQHGASYRLDVAGLTDAAGATIASSSATFATTVNAQTSGLTQYRARFTLQVEEQIVETFDADGHLVRRVVASDPGADRVWGTADDTLVQAYSYSTYVRDDQGRLAQATTWMDAGPDGTWQTADDLAGNVTTWSYAASGAVLSTQTTAYPLPGLAGPYASVVSHAAYAYNADGTLATVDVTPAPATDGSLGTGNDVAEERLDYQYDALGRVTRIRDSRDAGVDGQWFSADDTMTVTTFTYGDDGRPSRVVHVRSEPGLEQVGGHSGDSYEAYTYDGRGNVQRIDHYLVGPDGIAGNADDLLQWFDTWTYDAHDNRTSAFSASAQSPTLPQYTASFDTGR